MWYVRVGSGPRVRIRAVYGSSDFMAEYRAAIAASADQSKGKAGAGTLAWLWDRYRQAGAWTGLSLATRRQRENIMRPVIEKAGEVALKEITRKEIVEGRDLRSARPAMARHFVDTMRGMFEWAVDAEIVKPDPTRDVHVVKPRTDGHLIWTDEEIERFRGRWEVGTRERVAFDLLYFTGLRRGDAVRVGRQHMRDDSLVVRTEKAGETVVIRIQPELAETLQAGPTRDLAFIVGERGNPMTKESFGNWFRQVSRSAGCPGSAHGLRKALATRLANNGATSHELEALFGWRGGGMASPYTRKANRTKLAGSAMDKLASGRGTNNLSPRLLEKHPHLKK